MIKINNMEELLWQIFVWWFMICIFPGGIIGVLISCAYEEYTDTDHWFGMFYWPILLIIMIIKDITDTRGTMPGTPDGF